MFLGMRGRIKRHWEEMMSTIKLIDIEERFDLYFSRFFGLLFARVGKAWHMTPTQISIISLVIGVVGGGLLYYQENWKIILLASCLITWAGVLDSADGQLARMTGQSTELGRIIDGVIDNFVFLACYLGGTIYLFQVHGWWMVLLAVAAGMAHSNKSAIYEFYKSEYLFYGGPFENARIEYPEEFKKKVKLEKLTLRRLLMYSYLDYTKRQFWISTRTRELREDWRKLAYFPKTATNFIGSYRKLNKPIMFWWALICGTNTQRTMIMVLSLLGRFDIYLWITLISLLPALVINLYQKRRDNRLASLLDQ